MFVRQQLLAYLNNVPPGTRIAIFGLSTQLTILQSFTSDPALLKAVASAKPGRLLYSRIRLAAAAFRTAWLTTWRIMGGVCGDWWPICVSSKPKHESAQLELRIRYTLDAVKPARALSFEHSRPVRISSGSPAPFPSAFFPTLPRPAPVPARCPTPFAVVADYEKGVSRHGKPRLAVGSRGISGRRSRPHEFARLRCCHYSQLLARSRARMNQDQNKFFNDTAAEHSTMSQMAEAAGEDMPSTTRTALLRLSPRLSRWLKLLHAGLHAIESCSRWKVPEDQTPVGEAGAHPRLPSRLLCR